MFVSVLVVTRSKRLRGVEIMFAEEKDEYKFELTGYWPWFYYYGDTIGKPIFMVFCLVMTVILGIVTKREFAVTLKFALIILGGIGSVTLFCIILDKRRKWIREMIIDKKKGTFVISILGSNQTFSFKIHEIMEIREMLGAFRFYFKDGTWATWARTGFQKDVDECIKSLGIPMVTRGFL